MALTEAVCLLGVVLILIYWYLTKQNNYWAKRNIPYDKPTFLFGSFFDTIVAKRNLGQIYGDIYNKFRGEKVVGLFLFTKPVLLIRDPTLASKILTSEHQNFSENDFTVNEDLDPVLSGNIFAQTGEKWKRNRQALSPAFTVNKIKATFEKIQTTADKLIKYIESHTEDEVQSTTSRYTSEIVASWGIGIDGHSFDSDDPILPKLGKMIFQPSLKSSLTFLFFSFSPFLTKVLRLKFLPDDVPNFFTGVVKDLIQTRRSSNVQHKDFLQYFMDLKQKRDIAKNADQNDVTDNDILNGIVSFFIEGYETSSMVLSLLLYHLVIHQKVQNQLREEIDELFEKEPTPSFDSISELPLLSRTLSETVRLHGALSLAKKCTQTCTLDLGDGKSVLIEEGTQVVIPINALHTDPEYWPNPETFDPSRFTEDKIAGRIKGTYMPFGDGPRICIGMRIANAIIKTAVVKIVRHYELVPTGKTAPKFQQDPLHFLSKQKGGVYFKFLKRNLG